MNKLHFILIGLVLLFAKNPISAQNEEDSAKRALEREIKTSGLYLYGEAVGKDKAEATKLAKSMLISEINRETMNHPEWQFAKTIKADDIEYSADMIDLARGNRTRVIAYLKKENIQAIFSDNVPKIKLSDKKEEKEAKPQKIEETVPETINEIETASSIINDSTKVQSELLMSIVNAKSFDEANRIIRLNKSKGKIVSGGINTLIDSSKAYILIYSTNGDIVAVLDKGEGTERKDLISGENKNVADLYSVKGNMRIWFQLF